VTSIPSALTDLTLAEARAGLAVRQFSARELTEAYIAAMEAARPLNAFITETPERALEMAAASDERLARGEAGPIEGIPIAIKDLFCTKGILTTAASHILDGFHPPYESTVTEKLWAAGGVMLGKTNMDEFAMGSSTTTSHYGPTENPWRKPGDNRPLVPGGSSGGSAAAVAAHAALGGTGTDTGGSIRQPASFCGIVGLKPTYGLVSRYGVYANSFSFDHAGPMTWTVEDCAIMLQAIAGNDPNDPASATRPVPDYRAALTGDIKGLRLGVVRHLHEDDCAVTQEVSAALEEAFAVLRSLGATLGEVRLRPAQDYYDVKVTIAESELLAVHEHPLRTRPGDFGEDFLGRVLPAVLISARDYVQAQRERRRILAEMAPAYENFDVLVTATAGGPAPRLETWRTI
jgi:aspartyl-tRNA(Asn)/glutamyl-tRNA(Gln) amidotransferase subunit A